MRLRVSIVAMLAAGSMPAMGQDNAVPVAIVVGAEPTVIVPEEPVSPLSGLFETYVVVDPVEGTITTSPSLTLDLQVPVNNELNFGIETWVGFDIDARDGTAEWSDPELTVRLSSVTAGTIEVGDPGTAMEYACLTPAAGSSNFGTEDLLTLGTCTGYSSGKSVLYTSPEIGGATVYLSAMGDPLDNVDAGEVDHAISGALFYGTDIGEAALGVSLGIDKALSIKGDNEADLPTALQAGAHLDWDGWTFGAAAEYEFASLLGGNAWGVGVGVSREVLDRLTITAEAAANGWGEGDGEISELSLAATAEYELVDDSLWLDAGVTGLRTRNGGDTDTSYGAGVGLYFAKAF